MSRANKEYLNTILSDVSAHVRAYSADENRISTAVVLKDSTLLMVQPQKQGIAKPTFKSFAEWTSHVEALTEKKVDYYYYSGTQPPYPQVKFVIPEGVQSSTAEAAETVKASSRDQVILMLKESLMLAEETRAKREEEQKSKENLQDIALKNAALAKEKADQAKTDLQRALAQIRHTQTEQVKAQRARDLAIQHIAKLKKELEAARTEAA